MITTNVWIPDLIRRWLKVWHEVYTLIVHYNLTSFLIPKAPSLYTSVHTSWRTFRYFKVICIYKFKLKEKEILSLPTVQENAVLNSTFWPLNTLNIRLTRRIFSSLDISLCYISGKSFNLSTALTNNRNAGYALFWKQDVSLFIIIFFKCQVLIEGVA